MITPEDTPPHVGAASDQQSSRPLGVAPDDGRMTLEELARVLPIRNIWGLFKAYRGEASGLAALGLDQFNANARSSDFGADPMASAQPQGPSWKPAPLPDDADEATRAAYSVANQQFLAGEAVAKELAQTAMMARAQDVPTLLNRLLEAYSDLGSVFVQLIGAAMAQAQSAPQSAPQAAAGTTTPAAAPQTSSAISVEVTASCPVTARALLYAPLGDAPAALAMTRIGGNGVLPAPEVKVGPVIHITVPQDAAPGEYHGIILADAGGAPAGTATVTIATPA